MPTDKKRINLTVPNEVYARLQKYKAEKPFFGDATACLSLIVQALNYDEYREKSVAAAFSATLKKLEG